jgi:hypothetical protein
MENNTDNQSEAILKLLKEKAVMKQTVYSNTIECFDFLKTTSKKISDDLIKKTKDIDSRVTLNFKEVNQHSFQIKVAGDILHFDMHTNVFEIEKSNPIYKSGYVKQASFNSYSGIISVYNFLSDSFKYNRINDVGFLIARIFINREKKFFIETKTNLNHRYSNFSDEPINQQYLIDIINELIIFSINFDLTIPPYEAVKQVSVYEMQEKANSAVLRTGKRLGYLGSSDEGGIEDDFKL